MLDTYSKMQVDENAGCSGTSLNCLRVLVVEDDRRVASFLEKGLTAEGCHATVVDDVESAVEEGLAGDHQLIVLDRSLPSGDGVDVCRLLRERGVQTPVLMLTARGLVDDKIQGFEAGADDYLTKPFAFEELLARIRALRRRGVLLAPAPVRYQVDDLSLNREDHEVRRAGESIHLTCKEFALLEYFMKNPRRILSRAMIEDRVWGCQEDLLTNVVDVYIRRLRKKLNREGLEPLIHTTRGVGYRLKAG